MIEKILIDTDVIMNFFFERQPFVEDAAEIFSLCENDKIEGFTTPVIIANVYYLLRKTAKHDLVVSKLKQLLSILDVLQMDRNCIIDALNSNFKDFEDALQNFATTNSGMLKAIVTRNIKDFQNSELAILTPELFLRQRAVV